jgi:pilus assembly protein CpaC
MNACSSNTYRALFWILSVCLLMGAAKAQAPPAMTPAAPPATAPAVGPAPAVAPAPAPATAPVIELRWSHLPDSTATLISTTRAMNQPLHVLVGRSLFIKSVNRLKRVYVSNPVAVDSFTATPTQIVVTAKSPGVSSLILWDEWGESATYLVFADLDVANLQPELRAALPNDNVMVAAQEDRVSLSGTASSEASAEAAVKLAALYTNTVINSLVVRQPHTGQVRLKVEIVEIDRSKIEQFGFNFLSQGKNTSASQAGQFNSISTVATTSTGPPTLTVSSPLNLLFYNSGLNVGVTLQDLQDRQLAQILAEPTITALSGQKASFLAGGEFPFPVVQGSSGGLTSITIQFRPYGVKLEFTPVVHDDRTILLKVAPEVSALDYSNAVTISGYTIPAISTRRADTEVELRDGQTFAISGLLDHRTTDIFNKMPGIGDVPILGQLFRSKNVNHSTAELLVIVTPTIVDPLTDITAPALPQLPVPMINPADFDPKIPTTKPAAQSATGGTK